MFDLKIDSFESSNLAELEFATKHNILRATFKNGSRYLYSGVPTSVFENLKTAESKGKAFNEFVKKAGYPYKKEER